MNQHVYNACPIVFQANTSLGEGPMSRTLWNQPGAVFSKFYGESATEAFRKSSDPVGYGVPYAMFLAPVAGGLGATNGSLDGDSDLAGSMAAGKNAEATIACTGTLTALQLQTVISMVANLTASGTISNAQAVSFVNMLATIACTGSMTAERSALSNLIAALSGSASLSPQMNATANLEADITPFTELSPENLASSVWSAIAADNNVSGTMGEKVNAAGTAGDPWTADLTSYNTDGTAGKTLKDAQKKAKGAYLNTI